MRKRAVAFLFLFAGASVFVGFLWNLLFGQIVSLHPEQIGDWLNGLGPWAPLVFVAAMMCAVVISPIPSVPLDVAAGLAFGWFWGTVYTLIGAEVGAIVAFLIARRLGRPWLAGRLPQSTMAKFDDLAGRQGVRALLVMRLLPVFNFDWVSYAAGLTSVPLPVFAVATFVGMMPPVIAIVAVGATLTDNPVLSGAIFAGLVILALGPLLLPWLPVIQKKREETKMSTETSQVFDAIVIGGGTAGMTAAKEIARERRRVVLIEADRTGGDCLYTGCVPSKSLIATARMVAAIRKAAEYGVITQDPILDFGKAMARKTRIIDQISEVDSPAALEAAGVSVVTGKARFVDSNTVAVGNRKMQSRRIVIATGSRPAVPPIPGLKSTGYLTNVGILSLGHLPSRLAVIGAGPIGLELGQVFLRFGSQVTVIEQATRLLGRDDHEVAAVLGRSLAGEGLDLIVGHTVTGIERVGSSKRLRIASLENVTQMVEVDEILVATGRTPNTEDLDLAAAGIEMGPAGIRVDRRMRTSTSHIWACGDVVGSPFFTHVAEDQARTVAAGVLGRRSSWNGRAIPWVTFTDPEVAGVGMTEVAARERYGNSLDILRLPFEHVDRAITEGVTTGLIKVLLAPGWLHGHLGGQIVGAHIVGANAGEMIQQFAFQMTWRLPAGMLAKTVQAYPTFCLGGRQAVGLHWTRDENSNI